MTALILELVGILGLLVVAAGIALLAWPYILAGLFLFVATEAVAWSHDSQWFRPKGSKP